MKKNGITEIKERFRRMGKNIAHTYLKYWKPINVINEDNVKDVIATVYKNIINSNVSIEFDSNEKLIIVRDTDCPLCKYHFEDIEVAGCEILAAMIAEMVFLINKESETPSSLSLKPLDINESRVLGSKNCIQIFKYTGGRG